MYIIHNIARALPRGWERRARRTFSNEKVVRANVYDKAFLDKLCLNVLMGADCRTLNFMMGAACRMLWVPGILYYE